MRRFLIVLLIVLTPLQYGWSMAMGVAGHDVSGYGYLSAHSHDLDHPLPDVQDHDVHDHSGEASAPDQTGAAHNEDGHHDHYHPNLPLPLLTQNVAPDAKFRSDVSKHSPHAFPSRNPPPLDRPPLIDVTYGV